MTSRRETVVARLKRCAAPDRVHTDLEMLRRRSLDNWPLRLVQQVVGWHPEPPLCVITPTSTAEVSRALACLYEEEIAIVPYGGGSGVGGGAQPPAGAAVIDLGRMDRILALDETNLTVTVQAGVYLGKLEAYLSERGYTTGHYPQSIDLAQVGGLVATRSAGQFSTRYGNIEEMVVALEAVLPDGRVTRIGPAPRRAVGPDLRHLWIGSEGTLGVITEVTLKLVPLPAERWMQAYLLPSMRQGLGACRRIMRDGWRPAVVRLHDHVEVERMFPELSAPEGSALLLLLSEGPKGYAGAEGEGLDRIVREAGAQPLGEEPLIHWLGHRNDVSSFHKYIAMGVLVDTIEVAAGWSQVADLYERVIEQLRSDVPELAVVSGHSSHSYTQGTNLYFILGAVPEREPGKVAELYERIWSRVMEVTLATGGTICHHHGIGRVRAPFVPAELGSAYPLLLAVKQALDPKWLMNPGALLPNSGAGRGDDGHATT